MQSQKNEFLNLTTFPFDSHISTPLKKKEIPLLLIIEISTSLILLLFLAHIPSITTKNRQIPHPLKLLWTLLIVGDKRSLPPTLGQQHSRFYPILSTFVLY